MLVGTGRRCINPPAGIAHAGWGAQRHERAEGIDQELWVTAIAISDESGTTTLILDLDMILLSGEPARELRAGLQESTGIPLDRIRVSYSHSHSTPVTDTTWIREGAELVEPWLRAVQELSKIASGDAIAARQSCRVRGGRGESLINVSRRAIDSTGRRICGKNREGFSDHEVIVVTFESLEGATVATLVNFGCHPTVMGPGNRLVTPDYPGATRRTVEAAVGGRCLFLQGAAGDQGPVQGFVNDPGVYLGLGQVLGHEAAKIALSLHFVPVSERLREVVESGAPLGLYEDTFPELEVGPLKILRRHIEVPVRPGLLPVDRARAELKHWQEAILQARGSGDEEGAARAVFNARRADIQLRMSATLEGKKSLTVEVQMICSGDLALVSCDFEPFARTGVEIKQQSPFPVTLFSGYSNELRAYMPPLEELEAGGYESEISPFGEGSCELFQEEVIRLLHEIRGQTTESSN